MSNAYKFIITNNSVTLFRNSEQFTMEKDSRLYHTIVGKLVGKMTPKLYEELIAKINPINSIQKETKNKITVKNGKLAILGDTKIPESIRNHIKKCAEINLPYDAVLNFWKKLQNNVTPYIREQLFGFMKNVGISLTEDGCFVAYKKVRHDFMDFYAKKYDNSPGKIVSVPREQVVDDPNQTCAPGLHVATFSYMSSHNGDKIMEVKVDPKDVVSVPIDYNNAKMRVCRYQVIKEFTHESFANADIEKVVVDPIYFDDNKPDPKQEYKTNGKSTVILNRISKGRLSLPKSITSIVGTAGDYVGMNINDNYIEIIKGSEHGEYTYKIDMYGMLAISKSILDKISTKKSWMVVAKNSKITIK
jgi:hypothetical protein